MANTRTIDYLNGNGVKVLEPMIAELAVVQIVRGLRAATMCLLQCKLAELQRRHDSVC